MLIVHVDVNIKPEAVDAFIAATVENARSSLQEAGIARFDVIQDQANPTHFVLVEVYRTADDPARLVRGDDRAIANQPAMAARQHLVLADALAEQHRAGVLHHRLREVLAQLVACGQLVARHAGLAAARVQVERDEGVGDEDLRVFVHRSGAVCDNTMTVRRELHTVA